MLGKFYKDTAAQNLDFLFEGLEGNSNGRGLQGALLWVWSTPNIWAAPLQVAA